MPSPLPAPDLNIPPSESTVTVSIIDTSARVNISSKSFYEPTIAGNERLDAVCYSFLIKRNNAKSKSKYDTLIFDLGVRKDLENAPQVLRDRFEHSSDVTMKIDKNVIDILKENAQDPAEVGAIIWSHWHFDHTGDPSTFPHSTDLIVGPGFKEAFVPAYPTKKDSPIDERAWEGRELVEIAFDEKDFKIGQYKAYDFYGDGSFYLLDTPGHAVGHMCGLARTSANPPEFIFMGGDIAHHGGEFRPTKYLPLPENVNPNPLVAPFSRNAPVCPGSIFESLHPGKSSIEPFTKATTTGAHADPAETQRSIDKLADFDANAGVFVNVAHDTSLYDVVEFYPKTANGWSQKRWKEEGRWRFLRDFDTGDDKYKPE